MVVQTTKDTGTWYECETCGLLFGTHQEAQIHEERCTADSPDYIR